MEQSFISMPHFLLVLPSYNEQGYLISNLLNDILYHMSFQVFLGIIFENTNNLDSN